MFPSVYLLSVGCAFSGTLLFSFKVQSLHVVVCQGRVLSSSAVRRVGVCVAAQVLFPAVTQATGKRGGQLPKGRACCSPGGRKTGVKMEECLLQHLCD